MSGRLQSETRPKVRHRWSKDRGGQGKDPASVREVPASGQLQESPGLPEEVPALVTGGFQDCEQTTLALIARMGVYPSPEDLQRGTRPRRPVTAFRSAARVVVAVTRFLSLYCSCWMQSLVRKWKRATRVESPVIGGTVDLQQGYAQL
ncbi:uncharacterized protein [Magallana gigas]|uniref:uncharacterized protein isoform X2 n=1 Tax=Magallana gigas TaxID=29159 RepID=UPI00333F6E60